MTLSFWRTDLFRCGLPVEGQPFPSPLRTVRCSCYFMDYRCATPHQQRPGRNILSSPCPWDLPRLGPACECLVPRMAARGAGARIWGSNSFHTRERCCFYASMHFLPTPILIHRVGIEQVHVVESTCLTVWKESAWPATSVSQSTAGRDAPRYQTLCRPCTALAVVE